MLSYLIAAAVGAALGFLYYKFVGCATGACPITSNPLITTLYGGILGVLVVNIFAL